MYVKCGDQYYVGYMVLTKQCMDFGVGKWPELVMYRCSTYLEFIMSYLQSSVTLSVRRDSRMVRGGDCCERVPGACLEQRGWLVLDGLQWVVRAHPRRGVAAVPVAARLGGMLLSLLRVSVSSGGYVFCVWDLVLVLFFILFGMPQLSRSYRSRITLHSCLCACHGD